MEKRYQFISHSVSLTIYTHHTNLLFYLFLRKKYFKPNIVISQYNIESTEVLAGKKTQCVYLIGGKSVTVL